MFGQELGVEQRKPAQFQARNQVHQRHLGRVGAGGKHAFAKKHAAQVNAVKPADQFAVQPTFNRMGQIHFVHFDIGANDFIIDPRIGMAGARFRARLDHPIKRAVAADLERFFTNGFFQRPGNVKLI